MGAKAQDTEPAVTAVRDRNAVGNRASLTDAAGNQVAKTVGADAWTYGFDYRNRMTSFDAPESDAEHTDATYAFYPHHWARRSRTVGMGEGAVTTRFLYDGDNDVAEYDASGVALATFVTPFLDQNLSMTIPAGLPNAGTYFYMQDGLGSVRNLLDAAQAVVNRYDYEAFGQPMNAAPAEAIPQPFAFSARRYDSEDGLLHLRNRQYVPRHGTFASRDAFPTCTPTQWSDRRYSPLRVPGLDVERHWNVLAGPGSWQAIQYLYDDGVRYEDYPWFSADIARERNRYWYAQANPVVLADPLGLFTVVGGGANTASISIAIQNACNRIKDLPECLVSKRYKDCMQAHCSGGTQVHVDTPACQASGGGGRVLLGHAGWGPFSRDRIGLCVSNINRWAPGQAGSTAMHEFGHLCGMFETHAYQVSDWFDSTASPPEVRHGMWGDACKCGEVTYVSK